MKNNKLMIAIVACAFVMPVMGQQNQTRRQKINTVKILSAEVAALTALRMSNLNDENLNVIIRSLRTAKRTLNGRDIVRPIPNPRPRLVACANDFRSDIVETESRIQRMAIRSFGMTNFRAQQFATNWSNSFPCSSADKYINNARTLKEVANKVFDLTTFRSEQYAQANVEKLCTSERAVSVAQRLKRISLNRGATNFRASQFAMSEFGQSEFLTCSMKKIN